MPRRKNGVRLRLSCCHDRGHNDNVGNSGDNAVVNFVGVGVVLGNVEGIHSRR